MRSRRLLKKLAKQSVLEIITDILVEDFEVQRAHIKPETMLDDIGLLTERLEDFRQALEVEFDIEIDEADLYPILTVGGVASFVDGL